MVWGMDQVKKCFSFTYGCPYGYGYVPSASLEKHYPFSTELPLSKINCMLCYVIISGLCFIPLPISSFLCQYHTTLINTALA